MSMGAGYGAVGGLAGVLIGLGCCLVVTSVVDSGTHTVFVCWAEHPAALQQTHPEQFTALAAAWQQFQPEVRRRAGAARRAAARARARAQAWVASGYGAQFASRAV